MMALAYEMKRYQSLAAVFLLFKSSLGSMGTVFPFFGRLAFLFLIGKLFLWEDPLKSRMTGGSVSAGIADQ